MAVVINDIADAEKIVSDLDKLCDKYIKTLEVNNEDN